MSRVSNSHAERTDATTRAVAVQDVASKPVISIAWHRSVEQAACRLQEKKISALVVVDDIGRCVGLITSSDVARYVAGQYRKCSQELLAENHSVQQKTPTGAFKLEEFPLESVARHMTTCIQTIAPDVTVDQARVMMREQRIHHLVLLDESDRPSGIVSSLDLL